MTWLLNFAVGVGALCYGLWDAWHHWTPWWFSGPLTVLITVTNLVAAGLLWERRIQRQADIEAVTLMWEAEKGPSA